MDIKRLSFELKSEFKENNNSFTVKGYASVFDVVDHGLDTIKKGAFARSLETRTPLLLWQHNTDEPIGVITTVKEDDKGLYFEADLPKDDTFVKGRVIPQLKAGSIKGVSIGYYAKEYSINEDTGIRTINDIELFEISLVSFPMNESATITDVKSVMPFQKDLDFVRDDNGDIDKTYNWDSTQAVKRVRVYTGSENEPSKEYRKAFMWYDNTATDKFGSYKLPFVDIVNDEMVIIPRALSAIVGSLNGARGQKPDIPEKDIPKIKSLVAKYYKAMGEDDPFASKNVDMIKDLPTLSKFLKSKMTNREAEEVIYKAKKIFGWKSEKSNGAQGSDIDMALKELEEIKKMLRRN